MNQETANYIMQRMSKYLDNSQMIKLNWKINCHGGDRVLKALSPF